MKVLHIITGLENGGAEAVLVRLCFHDPNNNHVVISLSTGGKYAPILRSKNFEVYTLEMSRGPRAFVGFFGLLRLVKVIGPDVVQTWMYHADFFGGLAAWMARKNPIVWGIHQTSLSFGKSRITTIIIAACLARLSRWLPTRIVACARSAAILHHDRGYPLNKMRYIFNGYDLSEYKPCLDAGASLRAELGIGTELPLLGMVARFDPYKDHANLLSALSILCARGIKFVCVLVGSDIDTENPVLSSLLVKLELLDKVVLLGPRSDIPMIMGSLDLHILSSSAEGFPNVVAEAMACGTPCVATDVGDVAFIVGDTGWVVPPHDPEALSSAIERALLDRRTPAFEKRSVAARLRIAESFSVQSMVKNYQLLWEEAISECAE